MSDEEKQAGQQVRVVDRRYKTQVDEGKPLEDRRPETPVAAVRPPSPTPPPPPPASRRPADEGFPFSAPGGPGGAAASSAKAAPEPPSSRGAGQIGFDHFIRSLYTQILIQLGLVEGPDGETFDPDVEGARQTIEILGLLQDKTKGNLTSQESRVLADALTSSRLAYVEATKRRR
ncbi:MAG: DUF1844 domain-containing protein [Nitrospirae bacterium]|nr:DUF1844 domain-containing protein [Nitrospirota bacterium]